MNGMELLKKVKAINPSVKTILISAYRMDDEVYEQCNCVDTLLQKPISISDLICAVKTLSTSHLAQLGLSEKNLSLVLSNTFLTFIFFNVFNNLTFVTDNR